MTPPARPKRIKKVTPASVELAAPRHSSSWTTASELEFLRGLGRGTFALHVRTSRPVLLQRYLESMALRVEWGAIDALAVRGAALDMLQEETAF